MPDKPLNGARLQFCREYTTSGHNGAEAYRVAYPGCKSGHRQCASLLLTNTDIIREISRLEAKGARKQEADRQYCIKGLQKIADNEDTTDRNRLTAFSLLGDFNGGKREKAPNEEKVAEILARMSDEEIQTRRIVAKMRTDELSGPKLSKDKEIA